MSLGNKEVLGQNLSRYMKLKGIDRKQLSSDLNISYSTITDWINGKTYPRIDKIEMLANYFGIAKSNLVEYQGEDLQKIAMNNRSVIERGGNEFYKEMLMQQYKANKIYELARQLPDELQNKIETTVQQMVDGLNSTYTYTPTTLTRINDTASRLDEDRQEKVLEYAEEQLEEQSNTYPLLNHDGADNVLELPHRYPVKTTEHLSAGLGYAYQEQNETNTVYTDRDDLKRYDVASVVKGNSMSPKYNDGDVVLIQAGYDNSNGSVYAVDYDGETFLKRVFFEGDRIRLVSINREYKDIHIYLPIEDGTYLNIVGKVVDSFTPIQPAQN